MLMLAQGPVFGQTQQYFRILSPTSTVITSIQMPGALTWSNAVPGFTCTVEVADTMTTSPVWRAFAYVPVTSVVQHAVFSEVHPTSGMARVPAGSFLMGNCMDTNESDSTELPVHTVYLSEFYMDRSGVTLGLWNDVYNWATNRHKHVRYQFDNPGVGKGPNHPVVVVSWYDIVKWCNARSEKEGLTPSYYTSAAMDKVYRTGQVDVSNNWVNWHSGGYRIPTEAQCEKAARGGLVGRRFPWGDTISYFQANYYAEPYTYSYDASPIVGPNPLTDDGVWPLTSPAFYFAPNGYGIYDVAGNGAQWNWDWYDGTWYSNPAATQADTPGPESGTYRMIRGGCWYGGAIYMRCSNRVGFSGLSPTTANGFFGFRCVR
jgi:sulfatase modifying factor 1